MAALSVHRARLGRKAPMPPRRGLLDPPAQEALAATPPARHTRRGPHLGRRPMALVTSTSTTAWRKEAATSAVAASGCLRTVLTTES